MEGKPACIAPNSCTPGTDDDDDAEDIAVRVSTTVQHDRRERERRHEK